jgi:tetratricopeptide (TPR) repeat protein
MAARAERVATVVATLPVNARDFPPPGELPLNQPRFIAGWVALERRRWREAVKLLREALTVRPSEPMTHFALAKSLDAAGAPGAVGEYFAAIEAADGDRCSPTRNALLRRAAAQYGAAVADVDEVIRGQAPGGIPGWESFLDGVHWRRSLDAAVADEVARAAARAPAASAEKRAPRTWATEEASDFSMRAISDALQIGEEIDPPILSERVVAEFSHAAEIDEDALWVKLADPEGAERRLTGNEWTHFQRGRVQPYWGIVQASAAEAYVRRGEDEKGRKLLASASHYPQASPLSEFLIGLSFWRRGRTKEAERRWQSLPETSRERTMARYYKALN